MGERTWLCCHNCRWIESATYVEPQKVNADGFCLTCGEPAADPFDKDLPYDQAPPMTDKALEAAALKSCPICDKSVAINNGLETGLFNYVKISCSHPAEECPDGFDAGHSEFTVRADTVELAVAAWNRRAPLSALPGEAEVVGAPLVPPVRENPEVPAWLQMNNLFTTHRINPPPTRLRDELVTFMEWAWYGQKLQASLQAMQVRAEAAERERDEASREIRSLLTSFVREHFPDNTEWRPLDDLVGMITQMDNACTVARDYLSRAEAAEARVKELEEALERAEAEASKGLDTGETREALIDIKFTARTALKGGSNG